MGGVYTNISNLFWHCIDRIACRIEKVAELYDKSVGTEYRKEREKFDLSKAKNVLHIGCGSYPITAMTLAETNHTNIVTIDTNCKSVKLANDVIHRGNFVGKITAAVGDGTKYPLEEFDTIIVSGCSVPKIEVTEYILKNAKPQSRIIIRESYSSMKSLINRIDSHKNIEIIDEMDSHPFLTSRWKSFYLMKK